MWCPWGGQFGTLLQHNSTIFSERDSGCDFRAAVVLRWRPDDGQARVRVLFRTRLLRVVEMLQYAQHHGMARRIQLPAAFPPPCPEQIPQDPFWVPWAPAGLPFRYPWAPPWALFGGLGHLLVSPWTPFGTRTKKETKSDMEDPRFGVQVGTQNRHFSAKSGNKHDKMGSQTGSGKRVLS